MGGLPSGTVTFLFSDIEGSTGAWDADEVAMGRALARHDELLAKAMAEQGGLVVKSTGDGVMAVFVDAGAAVVAAIDAQRQLGAELWATSEPARVRMGLHTGTAERRGGDYFGVTPTRASRVMAAAHGGQILVSGATAGLIRGTVELVDLGEHLVRGIQEAEHLFQIVADGLDRDFPPLATADTRRHNLPVQRTSFVGQEDTMATVREALGEVRLVTLTGVGGSGKTRLALEVATRELTSFPDGVYLVDLTPIAEPALVPGTVLRAVGAPTDPLGTLDFSEADALLVYLASRTLMLVLDNCEHLINAAADLADAILAGCPDVRILATSREALEVEGEHPYRVPSLTVPSEEGSTDTEAVRLFVDRASAVRPGFVLDEEHARPVAEICRRLDGIPLAIELAAARVSHLSPAEITARLDDRFRLLTGRQRRRVQRQQTLQAAMDWSWDLLADAEQSLLRRLAVFAGGFTLEAVEGVSGLGSEAVDLLASLVDKSLVVAEEDEGASRYRLLETVRLYAQERLVEAGEAEDFRRRHREWFVDWVEGLEPGADLVSLTAAERVMTERDNLRAAFDWALADHDLASVLPLFQVSLPVLSFTGGYDDSEEQARAVLDQEASLAAEARSRVWAWAAMLSMVRADFDEMEARAQRALDISEAANQVASPVALALRGLRYVFEDPVRFLADVHVAVDRARDLDQPGHRRWIEAMLGAFELLGSDVDGGLARLERVVGEAGEDPDRLTVGSWAAWSDLTIAYLIAGRPHDALAHATRHARTHLMKVLGSQVFSAEYHAIALAESGDVEGAETHARAISTEVLRSSVPLSAASLLSAWVALALARGDAERASELLAAQRAFASQRGWRSPSLLALYRWQVAKVRAALDPERIRASRERGASKSPVELIAEELARI